MGVRDNTHKYSRLGSLIPPEQATAKAKARKAKVAGPAKKEPVARKPVAKKPAAKKSLARKAAAKQPAAHKPAAGRKPTAVARLVSRVKQAVKKAQKGRR